MTAGELVDLLTARLLRDHGGSRHHWRKLVGKVRIYSQSTHAHCNWAIDPLGNRREVEAIERLLDELRQTSPIIVADRL